MRSKINTLLLLILMVWSSLVNGQTFIAPDNASIEYIGRIDFSNPLKPRFGYSGVTIRAFFTGTSVKVKLSASIPNATYTNHYYCIIDEERPVKFKVRSGSNEYVLATGLEDKIHELKLIRITEGFMGIDTFEGLILDDNRTLTSLPVKDEHIIEFYGNSITSGFGIECTSASDPFSDDTENFYYTYAACASRIAKSKAIGISRSGIGLYRNNGGPVTGTSTNMLSTYYDRYMYNDELRWEFTGYTPDVVCVNLGTNDTSGEIFDASLFEANCKTFLNNLRGHYPNAKIVYLIGPMMSGQRLNWIQTSVGKVIGEINDPGITIFNLSTQTGDLGYGGVYHPNIKQNWRNAKELVEYLRTLVDWDFAPYVQEVSMASNGYDIELTLSEPLAENMDVRGFILEINDVIVSNIEASISGTVNNIVQISLSNRAKAGDKIELSYAYGNLTSEKGVALQAFYDSEIENPVIETEINRARVNNDGETIVLSFKKELSDVNAQDISLRINGSLISTFNSVVVNPERKWEVQLGLNSIIYKGDEVYVDIPENSVLGDDGIFNTNINSFEVLNLSYQIDIATNLQGLDKKSNMSIKCYPVPVKNELHVEMLCDNFYMSKLNVYNCVGQRVLSENMLRPIVQINTSGLKPGMYFIEVINGNTNERTTKVFVKD